MLGPVFAQLIKMAPQFQTATLPPMDLPLVPGLVLPQGSTPPYGDVDQGDHQPDVNPNPNGANSDLPRSTTSDHHDSSYTDGGFPLGPLGGVSRNPHVGGN
jgi:hypothetical protein